MFKNTHLADSLEKTEYESQYDDCAKELASNKQVLARIMKHVVPEFRDYDIRLIEECIEGTPEIFSMKITPNKKQQEKITGNNTESTIINEGTIRYDIRFTALTPQKYEQIKIILNVEIQKEYYLKYPLVTRGIFYCARMLSEQLNTEFSTDNYNDIKKVYSIWICTDVPEKAANTISEYTITRHNIYGEFNEEERYDLLTVIMIRLSGIENAEKGNGLLKMLTTLFSNTLSAEIKKLRLKKDFKMRMSKEFEGGINTMCNLSQKVKEEGISQGITQGLDMAHKRIMSLIQLMTADGISDMIPRLAEDSNFYNEMLQKYNL